MSYWDPVKRLGKKRLIDAYIQVRLVTQAETIPFSNVEFADLIITKRDISIFFTECRDQTHCFRSTTPSSWKEMVGN